MKPVASILRTLFPAVFSIAMLAQSQTTPVAPPVAPKQPKTIELHGDSRPDPYFWLREKTNPEVIAYLESENTYTASVMKDTEELQAKLYKEIVARIKETDLSVPVRRKGFYYYTRTEQGKQYPIWCRKKGSLDAPEEILIDGNLLAEGKKYFSVGAVAASPDQQILAYAIDTDGNEVYTIHFKDLRTGLPLPDRIPKATASVAWANDNKTFFYTVQDEALRPYKLFRHTLGGAQDLEIYHETDERFVMEIEKSRSEVFLWLELRSQTTSETRYLRADTPTGAFRVLFRRNHDIEYQVAHHDDSFFVRINDKGRNYRLVQTPVKDPGPANWKEIIPHRREATLEMVDAFKDHLVVAERLNGLRNLRIRKFSTGVEHWVKFDEPVYTVAAGGSAEYDTNVVRFTYTSLITPASVYDYDMDEKTRELKKIQDVMGGYDPSQYAMERIAASAADGTRVPISMVYRKGLKRDCRNPTLLYGYGSYGIPSEPGFSSERLSLIDRGFIFAIAHIRGGGDLGELWHDEGKMMKKRNTFTDFIACAQHLVSEKYTQPSKLAILGGSAGGLLMGAVVNMRAGLFGAVIAKVPFVDMLNTMMDSTLPLTVGEYEEWGNPAETKAYEYMRSYSPYDNVESQKFPNMLVTAGLNDPRVSYWEPAKWVARLRTLNKSGNLLLLKTNMGAGHFGASGRYDRFKETALDYAFLFKALGLPPGI